MQKILIIGYLGSDPDLKYTPQGAVIAQFSIATSERWKNKNGELQERTEWFAVKAFGGAPKSPESTFIKEAVSTWRVASVPSPGTTGRQENREQELQGSRLRGQDRVPGFSQQWQWRIHAGRVSRRAQHVFRGCRLLSNSNRN